MVDYVCVALQIQETEFVEILIAELGALGFDSFDETDAAEGQLSVVNCYVPIQDYNAQFVEDLLGHYQAMAGMTWEISEVKGQNWNQTWEDNFQPIQIDNQVLVRASFHPSQPEIPIDIVIDPKMTFGTGHHATTSLMMKAQLGLDHQGKRVFDAGTGTGILAILAHKLGASWIEANEVEDWSVEAARENAKANDSDVHVHLGPIREVAFSQSYDLFLANINRNVLLDEIGEYSKRILTGGNLLLSGFYPEDVDLLRAEAEKHKLHFVRQESAPERWTLLHFEKSA